MEIDISKNNDIDLIKITGNLDSNTAPDLQKEIIPLLVDNAKIVINMKDCEYVSSAGLRVLLMIAKNTAANGGKSVLAGLCEEVEEVMEMTGFGSIFPNFENVELALSSFEPEKLL